MGISNLLGGVEGLRVLSILDKLPGDPEAHPRAAVLVADWPALRWIHPTTI